MLAKINTFFFIFCFISKCFAVEEKIEEEKNSRRTVSMLICDFRGKPESISGNLYKKYAPCSSFKLPLAIMGFETGILKSIDEPAWVSRPDHNLALESWRGVHTPQSWIKNSVVWYSQELNPFLGAERIQEFLDDWIYGNRDISGDMERGDTLKHFWLDSSLQISVKEQVLFIYKILNGQFKIKPELKDQIEIKHETFEMVEKIFFIQAINDWSIYGKTGSGKYIDPENPCVLLQHGWFVGWCIKDKEESFNFYSFAVHVIEPYDAEKSAGPHAKEIMLKKLYSILS